MRSSPRFSSLIAASGLIGMWIVGCASSGTTHRDSAPGVKLQPIQVQLNIGLPSDSDGNGYPDTIQALAYLFPKPGDSKESKLPVHAKGTFEFAMQDPAGRVIARWIFPPDVVDDAARNLAAGVGYSMYLRLSREQDVMPPMAVDIRCRFTTLEGHQVKGLGRATVRLGG